jgi:hypothetical protein
MITHIDLSSVLQRTVCDLYSNLVTRPTGAAVRTEIEHQLRESGRPTLTVIDFSNVGLLDFSCADEIVAKLLMSYCERSGGSAVPSHESPTGYFLFRGVREEHLDAIEVVLDHHGLALVAQVDHRAAELVGAVDEAERDLWYALADLGPSTPLELGAMAGLDEGAATAQLEGLHRRRLVMRYGSHYAAIDPALVQPAG